MQTDCPTPPPKRRSSPPGASALGLCLLAALGCGGGDLVLPNDTGAASVAAMAGGDQEGTVGEELSDPIIVKVTDRQGQPVSGAPVAFAPDAQAGGSISPDTVRTGSDGLAAARWVLGEKSGSQTATANIAGDASLSQSFTATAAAASAQTLASLSGDNQSAPAGTALAEPLVVVVTDPFGNPVEGVEVSWDAQGGSVDPGSATSGADGHAATQRILGSSAGTQHATATVRGLDGSPVTFTHTATAGTASALALVSGNNQTGAPGAALAAPLVVRLVDGGGNPIAGTSVSWVIGTGGGSVAPPSADTDGDGLASATLTLGPAPGAGNTVNAVVSGVGFVTFTATATGGGGGGSGPSAANSTVSADPSTIQALSGTATITVTVRDGNGAPVSGATVRLSASGSGNTRTQPSGQTGADGIATGSLTSAVPGTKVISATANGVEITQTATVVVTLAPATTLTIMDGNGQTADAGSAVATPPSVRVTNDLGQGIAGFGVTFVVTGGNGNVTGASQTTNSNGVATVGSWVLGDPGTNTLEARAAGLNGSPAVFTATANGGGGGGGGGDNADHLIFQVQPASPQEEDRDFTPAVVVAIVDVAGNVVSLSNVEIRISTGPGDGKLDGHEKRDTQNGVAIFDDLRIKKDGDGYVLTATASRRPELGQVTSNSFDVNRR